MRERESKVSKIFEFSHSDVIALEDPRSVFFLAMTFLLVHLIIFSVRLLGFRDI